jgi:hypothetical protein
MHRLSALTKVCNIAHADRNDEFGVVLSETRLALKPALG